MPNLTSRLQLQLPLGNDSVTEIRTAITANANGLDAAVLYRQDVIANRPAPLTVVNGFVFQCTDVPAMFISDGTAWHYVPLNGRDTPIASMTAYAGTGDPADPDGVTRWLVCDGRAISRATYAALFAISSTSWGPGNGSTTFNIPDMRGRVPVGAGTGPGLSARTLGQASGEETHVLVTGEMPGHNHGVTDPGHIHAITDPGHTHQLPGASTASSGATQEPPNVANRVNDAPYNSIFAATTGISINSHTTGVTVNNTGGDGTHNNMQPFCVLNHIIKVA